MTARMLLWCCPALLLASGIGCGPTPQTTNTENDSNVSASSETETETGGTEKPDDKIAALGQEPAEKEGATNMATEATNPALGFLKDVPLIPRKAFFDNPEKARARISPDGKQLAYLAPVDGVLNVWVCPADDLEKAKAVTDDKKRGIRSFSWAYTNKHLLYTQDNDGDEDFHLYAINLEDGSVKDLTPIKGIRAEIAGVSEKFPETILVGINERDARFHDIYKVDINTGKKELIQENPGFAGFIPDDDYNIRFAVTFTPDAGQLYLKPSKESESGWEEWTKIEAVDAMTTSLAGFDKTGENVYLVDSRGDRDTAALKMLNLETGKETLLAENDKADISGALTHPTEKTVQAASFTYARQEWEILDDAIKPDLEYLESVADGELQITSRSMDDKVWTVAYLRDDGPVDFYLYHREPERKASFLFTSSPNLNKLPLVKMHPVIIKSRDGLDLVSYLTLPPGSDPENTGRPSQPLPMVLDVHGGPWARDNFGYNPSAQMLANRGYAVLNVNFRGSTGFGKKFINAADREWSGKMHDDLLDAVAWAIEEKIAQKDKIAIMGGSYGGYATLVGLTKTPDTFACGVDIVGPSSLITLLNNPPAYWMPFMPVMKVRVGDKDTEEGLEFLKSRSPLFSVDKITKPLLIAQGAQDPRVKQAEADQIVAAMNEKKIPVTYMLYPEEGHGFALPQNRFAFYAVTEAFLAENLGGRYQPIGDAFDGAKFEVPSGKDDVPGLAEAIKADE